MSNNCGVDTRDPSIGGNAYHPVAYSSGSWEVSLAGGEAGSTEHGGVWHICYCTSADGTACTAAADFATRAGTLTLYGPLPNQDFSQLATCGLAHGPFRFCFLWPAGPALHRRPGLAMSLSQTYVLCWAGGLEVGLHF